MKKFLTTAFIIFMTTTVFADDLTNNPNKLKVLPDIYIYQFLSDHHSPVKVGDSITFDCQAITERIGEEGWSSQLKVNGEVIKDTNGVNISMSGFGVWTEYKVPKIGHYVVECSLDSKDEIKELDETNNKKYISFDVGMIAQKTDTTMKTISQNASIKGIDIVLDEVSLRTEDGTPVEAGKETKIDCIWHRMGVEPSPFRVGVLIDGKPLGSNIGTVVDHTKRGTTLSKVWKATTGKHNIKCVADTQKTVKETNKTNNSKSINVLILPQTRINN